MARKKFTFIKALMLASGLIGTYTAGAQYCTSGMYTQLGCTGDHIQSFSTTGGTTQITNNNSGCSGTANNYRYYTNRTHTEVAGNAVNYSITNTPSFAQYYKIWVDYNADGDFLDAGEQVFSSGGTRGAGTTFTGSFTIPAGASVGQTRLRVRSGWSPLNGACDLIDFGEAEDYNLFIKPSSANNAIPGNVVAPLSFCEGTYPVQVSIRNNGTNVVNNVQIQWELDGVAQPTINYTTPIPVITATPGSNEAVVTLGSIPFIAPNLSHTFKVTVVDPNGVTNTAATGTNILEFKLGAGLNGTYTVGGTTPNFPTVVDAVTYLNSFGICGPTTVNVRPGIYTGRARLNDVNGSSTVNRITFQAENGVASTVTIQDATNGVAATSYVFSLNDASNVTLKNLSFNATGTSGSGQVIQLAGEILKDSIFNCNTSITSTANWNTYNILGADVSGSDNVFMNNNMTGGDYGFYVYSYNYLDNVVFNNNTILDAFSQSVYLYNATGTVRMNDNTVSTTGTGGNFINTYHSGIVVDNCGDDLQINRNRVKVFNGGIGMQFFSIFGSASNRAQVINNEIAVGGGANAGSDGMFDDNGFDVNYFNNSVSVSTGNINGSAAAFNYCNNVSVMNNAFSHPAGGRAMYVAQPTTTTLLIDYNNIHTTGAMLVGTDGPDYDSLSLWRAGAGKDLNSISYDPGFIGSFDLHPDVNNPASWSLNGRGVHIAGNTTDRSGTARVTARANGVPDLGAYEFVPGVIPPVAKAIPASPAQGITQIFTFGGDTVSTINWDATVPVPSSVAVRQYTGTVPPVFPVGNNMYFYTDIDVLDATYDLDANIYYKDPWMGKITNEANMTVAKKERTSPNWVAYNDVANTVSAGRNLLSGTTFTNLGFFTGIEKDSLFSAYIKPNSTTVFCNGGSVTLVANSANGYTYQWKLNGNILPGATAATFTAVQGGDYSVEITKANRVVSSTRVAVTVVASPSTHVTLGGPRRICNNSSVDLLASVAAGQTYQWVYNGVDIPGANTPNYTATSGGNYSLKVKNVGCANISNPIVITQGPLQLNLGRDTSFCQRDILVLDAQNDGAEYLWNTGATTQQIAVTTVSGRYWVEIKAGPDCFATDTIDVAIDAMPSVVGISSIRASGNTYQFEPSGVMNSDNFLWIFGDGTTDTARNITHEYTGGLFTLKLVVFNACGSDTAYLVLPLTVKDITGNTSFNLYPNPAQNVITLQAQGGALFNETVIINSIGQVAQKDNSTNYTDKKELDIRNLPDGYYIIKANTNDGKVISKPFRIAR